MQKIKFKHVIMFIGAVVAVVAVVAFDATSLDSGAKYNEDILASRCLSSVTKREVSAGDIIKMDYFGNKGEFFYRYGYGKGCFVDVVINKSGLCDVLGVSEACGPLNGK